MIRLVINAVPTRPGGGLTVLAGLLRGWRRIQAPLEITVLAADPQTLATVAAIPGTTCVEIDAARGSTWQRMRYEHRHLGRELVRLRADVLLTNNHYLFGVPCPQVVHHHNVWRFITPELGFSRPRDWSNRLRDWLARQALHKATANVFVSEFLRGQAESFVPDRRESYWVVRNALDDEVIEASVTADADQAARGARLVTVQSANPHKDNATVVRCLGELVRLEPDVPWHLSIAGGDGRGSWQPLRDLAEELGVAERITWCGYCDRAQLDRLLRSSLCLLATSRLEAGPLVGIEAIARQCVPVAARIPPRVEFLGDAGLLVDPHRPDQFARAVAALYHDPALRRQLVERGLERIRGFAWSDRARQLYELFARLAGSTQARAAG